MLARDWLNTYYLEDTGLFRVSLGFLQAGSPHREPIATKCAGVLQALHAQMDARTPEAPREGFRKGAEQRRQTGSAAARFLWRGPGYEACSASARAQTRAAAISRTRRSHPGNLEGTGIAAGAGIHAGTLARLAFSTACAT